MLFEDSYLTIKDPSEGIFKDRGSKFIAFAFPVRSETEIKERLAELRKEHPSANHHCYAWRLGPDKQSWRVNDDGEPSGTAGKPIFGQIQSNDLTNILVVVVRYFGGTLLGTGGLINAYREAAASAIKNSVINERYVMDEYKLLFDVSQMNVIMRLLREVDAKINSQDFTTKCEVSFYIRKQKLNSLEEKLSALPPVQLNYIKTIL